MLEKRYDIGISQEELFTCTSSLELSCSLNSSLKSKPTNQHFHFKKKGEKGVLEITLFEQETYVNIHNNRQGDWIAEVIKKFEHWIKQKCHP